MTKQGSRSSRRKLKKKLCWKTIFLKGLERPMDKRVLVGYRHLHFCYLVLGHTKDAVDIHRFRMVILFNKKIVYSDQAFHEIFTHEDFCSENCKE